MTSERPTLAQALDEDRKAFERAQAQGPETGFASLSTRLQVAFGLDCPMWAAGAPKLRRRPF